MSLSVQFLRKTSHLSYSPPKKRPDGGGGVCVLVALEPHQLHCGLVEKWSTENDLDNDPACILSSSPSRPTLPMPIQANTIFTFTPSSPLMDRS